MKKESVFETQTGETVTASIGYGVSQRFSAYGILERQGKVLVVKTHLELWEFPGGTPDPGETLSAGLIREINEEVGVQVTVGSLFFIRESRYMTPSNNLYHSIQFFFNVSDEGVGIVEGNTLAWMKIDELAAKNMNKGAWEALVAYMKEGGQLKYKLIQD